MNRSLRLGVLGLALALTFVLPRTAQAASIVLNGGFETGNFASWVGVGNQTFNGVQCPGPGPTVQSGNCSAFFGPIGTTGGITQNLVTQVGLTYSLSFWLLTDGGIPSSFSVTWDGLPALLSLVNPPAGATQYSFFVTATAASTPLTFLFRDDPGFMFLDSVSVDAVPEPGSILLLGTGIAALALRLRRKTNA